MGHGLDKSTQKPTVTTGHRLIDVASCSTGTSIGRVPQWSKESKPKRASRWGLIENDLLNFEVRCQLCVRVRTRTRPPPPACAHPLFLWRSAIKANVVGSLRSLNYRGPGSSSRPWGLPPASADPDRTHFTTLTIWDGESPSADDPGPSADDLRPSADVRRRPPAIRRRPVWCVWGGVPCRR